MLYSIRTFSTSVLPKLKKKNHTTTKETKTPSKTTNTPPHPPKPKKPWCLHSNSGSRQSNSPHPDSRSANKCVCVCVCVSIPVLFCLSPIACLEVAFFPEGFLFDEETDDLWLYVHWNTHTPPTHTKCHCTVNSFSPPPNRCWTVLQQFSDSSLNGTPRCSNPHSSWSLDYYRRISGFKLSLVRVKATLCWPSSRDRNHTI